MTANVVSLQFHFGYNESRESSKLTKFKMEPELVSSGSVVIAQIEPTTRCNFNCGFCCGRSMDQIDMPFEKFTALIDQFPDLRFLHLQGEGEPTYHPRFKEMIDYARAKGIRVSFITNGSLLTEELSTFIVSQKVDDVRVSIESPRSRDFKEIRKGSLRAVVNGIKNLQQAKLTASTGQPTVGLAITVLRRTINQFPELISFYRDLKLDGGITVNSLTDAPAYVSSYDDHARENMLDVKECAEVDALVASETDESIRPRYNHFSNFGSFRKHPFGCVWLESGVFVNAKGEMTGCCNIKDAAAFGFGNAFENLDSSIALRDQASRMLIKNKVPDGCRHCDVPKQTPWQTL